MYVFSQALADSIKSARLKMGLTQASVADSISIDSRTILNIENCNGNPKMEILYPLIRMLEIDPWEIFFPENTDGAAMRKMQLLLKDCTSEEIEALLPVCEAVLAVLKSKESIPLEPK